MSYPVLREWSEALATQRFPRCVNRMRNGIGREAFDPGGVLCEMHRQAGLGAWHENGRHYVPKGREGLPIKDLHWLFPPHEVMVWSGLDQLGGLEFMKKLHSLEMAGGQWRSLAEYINQKVQELEMAPA